MKICLQCGIEKDLIDFGIHLLSIDCRSDYCKVCRPVKRGRPRKTSNDKHQYKSRKIRTKLYNNEKKAITDRYKNKCVVCPEDDPVVLHFHHLRDKKFNVCGPAYVTEEELLLEISKCVILCANCHEKCHRKRFCLLIDKPI